MTELLPETIQEGHGRHSLCNSFRSFPTIPSTAPPEPSHRPCPKTELQPETIQEGHGRHSLCNSFRSFPTIPSTAPPEPSHRPCPKTELQPETIQEGHGRHSLCNSFRSFPPNTFGKDATSGKRRRRRAQGRRTPRCGSSGEPRL